MRVAQAQTLHPYFSAGCGLRWAAAPHQQLDCMHTRALTRSGAGPAAAAAQPPASCASMIMGAHTLSCG